MARKLKKCRYGGKLPKYNLGAITGSASTAGSLMGSAANLFTDDTNKQAQNEAFFKSAGFGIPGMIIGAFRAKKIKEQQEQEERALKAAQFKQRQQNFITGLEPTTEYTPIFPLGGMIPYGPDYNQPNAELETDEVYRLPNGAIQEVPTNTPPHEQGGIEMQLPPGTEILGEGKYQGQEFKDLGQKLERLYKKHQRILKNRPTSIARKTSEMMLDKTQKQYSKLMQEQESKRGNGTLNQDNYRMGGKTRKYQEGGEVEPWMLDPNSWGVSNTPLPTITERRLAGVSVPTVGEATIGTTGNAFISGSPQNRPFSFLNKLGNIDGGDALNAAATYAPIAYNIGRGLFGKPDIIDESDYQNPYETEVRSLMRGRRFNVNPILDRNRIAQRTYNRNVRNVGATPGAVLGNLQAGAAARMRADAAALAQKQNMDNQYLGQEAATLGSLGQTRANRAFQIRDINDQNRARQRSFLPTGLSQIQQAAQVRRQMQNQAATDRIGLSALYDLVPSYQFNYDYFNRLRSNPNTPVTQGMYQYRGE